MQTSKKGNLFCRSLNFGQNYNTPQVKITQVTITRVTFSNTQKYNNKKVQKIGNKKKIIKLIKNKYFCDGRFILWIRPLLLLRPFLLHFPHLFLHLRFETANNRYWLGYFGQHMPSLEHLGAGVHQM